MVHRIQEYKPNLKQHGTSVDTSDAKPALAYDSNSDIIMFSEESWVSIVLGWFKSGILFLLSSIVIFAILYVTLAVSLLFITPVDGKPVFVARGTFMGGEPALQDVVLASPTAIVQDDLLGRLGTAFMGVPNAQVVEVFSGPLDTINASNGTITVSGQNNENYDGTIVNDKGETLDVSNKKLDNQYLVRCVSGACEPNTFHFIDGKSIFGEVQNVKVD